MANRNTKTPVEPVRPTRVRKAAEPREVRTCRICRKPFSVTQQKLKWYADNMDGTLGEKTYLDSGLCRACFLGKTPVPADMAESPDIADTVHAPAVCPECGKSVPISAYFRNHGLCAKCAAKRQERENAKRAAAEKAATSVA